MAKNFTSNKQKGFLGEKIAREYLEKNEFKILETNYRYSKFSEIDIIAEKNKILHFVEVKTRTQKIFGEPVEAVDRKKLNSIFKCGMYYLKNNSKKYAKIQVDVVGIVLEKDCEPEIKFYENISYD